VLEAVGKGILTFRAGSSGATITGNLIAGVQSVAGTLGIGIHLDSSGTSRHTITGNVIKQVRGPAIRGEGGNNDIVISGNVIDGTPRSLSAGVFKLGIGETTCRYLHLCPNHHGCGGLISHDANPSTFRTPVAIAARSLNDRVWPRKRFACAGGGSV
jgi:hypothetical protein